MEESVTADYEKVILQNTSMNSPIQIYVASVYVNESWYDCYGAFMYEQIVPTIAL